MSTKSTYKSLLQHMVLYLVNVILLICLEINHFILSVSKLVVRYPLSVVLPTLGLKLCDFNISPKINLKILHLVLSSRTPGAFFSSASSKVEPAPTRFMVSTE